MKLLKQVAAILGTVTMIAALIAIVSPKTAHAVAASLVQIDPGTTTHVGQNETELVSLECTPAYEACVFISPEGVSGTSPYVVPSGYTLIVTDWQFFGTGAGVEHYVFDDLIRADSELLYPTKISSF